MSSPGAPSSAPQKTDATTLSAVYLAMRHIFPDVPISAGAFEPLTVLPAAPQTTTNAAAPQLTTAPALSPADGLRWAAVAVAGLAVVAALLQARKRPVVKAHADL